MMTTNAFDFHITLVFIMNVSFVYIKFAFMHSKEFAKYVYKRALQFYNSHLKRCEFVYRGIRITTQNPHVRPNFETICVAPKFVNWLDEFQLDKFDLRTITITDVDFFGPASCPDKLGFLKFKCEVYTKLGESVDSIVFLRGDCGAVLIVATDENENQWILLTEQPRIPTGGYKEEIVAGMFDHQKGAASLNAVLKKEIKEETGLDMDENSKDFISMGKFTLSGGGCDETVHIAVWLTEITSDAIESMKNKQYGEEGSNEKIRLKFYPANEGFETVELPRIADAKTSLAWYRYKNLILSDT
jgi:NUDIX domain